MHYMMQGLLQNNILEGIMNEKIKKLAEESGFYFYDLHDIDGQDLGETIESDDWESMERFAELIIRECVTSVYNRGKLYEIKDAGEHQSEVFANAIRKHFGIEDE